MNSSAETQQTAETGQRPRYILSVRAGHNASACIGDRSGLLFGIQEERLNGEKNYWGFPRLSIRHCMKHVGAKPEDIELISCGEELMSVRYHSRDDVLKAYQNHTKGNTWGRIRQRILMPLVLSVNPTFGQGRFTSLLQGEGLGKIPVKYYTHHTAHAATAYYGLRKDPNKDYLVLTSDGSGDGISATVRVWGKGQERILAKSSVEDSLGAIYAWVTYALGFVPMEHEYKLMGMAPYVSDSTADDMAKMFYQYLDLAPDGLTFQRKIPEPIINFSDRLFADIQGKRFDYICAGLQRFTEDILRRWVKNAVAATGIRDVLVAGGVFMNVKANKRIAELPEVDNFEAFPSCGDETLPLGAFYKAAAEVYGDPEVKPLQHFYLGDSIGEAEAKAAIEKYAQEHGYRYTHYTDDALLASDLTDLLISGHPVARACGPMEFGARALGNRSILADPKNGDAVRVINQMVKKRDFWMPFAPVVLQERQHEYIENPKNLRSPYMMMTFDTKENFRDMIAAVHNADLTCRAQLLIPEQNSELYRIMQNFSQKTGRGVLLNTSFNLHGFPIVRTALEALDVFHRSGLEHIQVGQYLVHKK